MRQNSEVIRNTPVSQRCNHKSISAAQVFVLISKCDVSDGDPGLISIFFEVEPALLQPFKVVSRTDVQTTLKTFDNLQNIS